MTVGVLAFDGLDWNMAERTAALSTLPGDPWTTELTNDLPGDPDHDGRNALFTPYVWTCIFSGELQTAVYGWEDEDTYNEKTEHLTWLWDKVPNTVVHNLKVAAHYLHVNNDLPDSWVPTHPGKDGAKQTTTTLVEQWNDTLNERQPPVFVQWFRIADWWGHHAAQHEEPLEPAYEYLRDDVFPALDFPERWILVSDHGFTNDTENGGHRKGAGSRHQHRPEGVLATNMDAVRYENMTDFVQGWHDDVLDAVQTDNLRALGYME